MTQNFLPDDASENETSYLVIGAAMEVDKGLGYGFLEKVYEKAMVVELEARGARVETQVPFPVFYRGQVVGQYFADMVVDGRVIVELKTMKEVTKVEKAQVLNYLMASKLRLGLIVNFSPDGLEWKRIVM